MKILAATPRPIVGRTVDIKTATLKIKDGGAEEITVKIGEGNFTYTENKNREYILNRGNLDDVRDGDDVPCELTFDATWEYITGKASTGGTPSVEDAMKQANGAVDWVTSDADTCNPYAVDVELVIDPTPAGCGDIETYLFSDFRYEQVNHDLRGGTLSFSGKCNVTEPTVSRSANS